MDKLGYLYKSLTPDHTTPHMAYAWSQIVIWSTYMSANS